MTTGPGFDAPEMTERFYTSLKSLNEFDKLHVRGVVQTLLSQTRRDLCVIGNYYRAVGNVETLPSRVFGTSKQGRRQD